MLERNFTDQVHYLLYFILFYFILYYIVFLPAKNINIFEELLRGLLNFTAGYVYNSFIIGFH